MNVIVYETFLAALNTGNLVDATDDLQYYVFGGRLGLLRILFAFYLSFTCIVLLNVLIAMMSERYKRAKQKAESVWRHDSVASIVVLQKYTFLASAFRWICSFNRQLDIHKENGRIGKGNAASARRKFSSRNGVFHVR